MLNYFNELNNYNSSMQYFRAFSGKKKLKGRKYGWRFSK